MNLTPALLHTHIHVQATVADDRMPLRFAQHHAPPATTHFTGVVVDVCLQVYLLEAYHLTPTLRYHLRLPHAPYPPRKTPHARPRTPAYPSNAVTVRCRVGFGPRSYQLYCRDVPIGDVLVPVVLPLTGH